MNTTDLKSLSLGIIFNTCLIQARTNAETPLAAGDNNYHSSLVNFNATQDSPTRVNVRGNKVPGTGDSTIAEYNKAFEEVKDPVAKVKYAARIADLYKKENNYSQQAAWLGKVYRLKNNANNVDLFNWGFAHYKAGEFALTDSVFIIYTTRYPTDIYGYYWRAQANAGLDSNMKNAAAIPFYNKVVEIGEQNKEKNRAMLLKAYSYLGQYEANISKDYEKSLSWFEKYHELDSANTEIKKYIETLQDWINQKNKTGS